VIWGRTDSLLILVISAGFLINGHVSFFAVVGVMLIGGLVANLIFTQVVSLPLVRRWGSKDFLTANRSQLLLSVGLGLLFLLPLLLETVINFPGPVSIYAKFSGGNRGNSVATSAEFTLSYLGGPMAAGLGLLTLTAVLSSCRSPRDVRSTVYSLLAVMIAATLAIFLYAKAGVDDLTHKYVAIHYYAVPAIGSALIAVCLQWCMSPTVRVCFAIGIWATCAFGWMLKVRQAPSYLYHYNGENVAELYQKIAGLGTNVVLDLDNTTDWGGIWVNMAGVQAFGKRRGGPPFCIATNWHVLFTPEARCASKQIRAGTRFLVTKVDANDNSGLSPSVNVADIALYPSDPPLLSRGADISVTKNRFLFRFILGDGWSAVDSEFVWSVGKRASVILGLPVDAKLLKMDLAAFVPGDKAQRIEVEVDGRLIKPLVFTSMENRRLATLDLPESNSEFRSITLHIKQPISPLEVGLSHDPRSLGVALYGLRVE
jgi:hypothetical protein